MTTTVSMCPTCNCMTKRVCAKCAKDERDKAVKTAVLKALERVELKDNIEDKHLVNREMFNARIAAERKRWEK